MEGIELRDDRKPALIDLVFCTGVELHKISRLENLHQRNIWLFAYEQDYSELDKDWQISSLEWTRIIPRFDVHFNQWILNVDFHEIDA